MTQPKKDFGSEQSLLTLLVRTGASVCALPISCVVETMRPLSIEPISDRPPFLRGLSVIRGTPTPVIALNTLMGLDQVEKDNRFVLLRILERRIALGVEEVLGIFSLKPELLRDLPPLFQKGGSELISSIGVLDKQLLLVLETTLLVPTEIWNSLLNREVIAS